MPKRVVALQRWQVVVAFVALAVAFVVQGVLLNRLIERNATALTALCSLRYDLDLRITASQAFLAEHPNGVPGIPLSVIQQSLGNSIRTRASLHVLDCQEAP
jgi:hypothetical protein